MATANEEFTAPIYRDDPPADDPTADGSDSPVFDLNDPELLLQEVSGDSSLDPYATPPPVPDGTYRAKLKQIDVKDAQGQPARLAMRQEMKYPGGGAPGIPEVLPSGKPKMYLQTAIEATILQPGGRFDNIKVYDRFFDSRTDRNGANKMLHLLSVLKIATPKPLNGKTLSDAVLKALAGEPEVDIQTQWEGQPSQDDSKVIKEKGARAPRIKGMHRFPQVTGADGKISHQPDMEVQVEKVGKVNVHAQAQLAGIFAAGSKAKK